jgi:RHS repeat-associated protein
LANHLGNVLTVISDKKTAVFTGTTFNYFAAERISATDYSPFGAPLVSRTWQSSEYRFGFNGQENLIEFLDLGNLFDFKFRGTSTRLGRFFAVDPLSKKFPDLSCYQFAGNTPIWARELEGLEPWFSTQGISQDLLTQTKTPLSMIDAFAVARGPYSIEFATSNNMTPTPSISFQEMISTPNGNFQPIKTIVNNSYEPYIPTSNDVEDAANKVGIGGTGLTAIGICAVCFGQVEIGLPLIEVGQAVSNIADAASFSADLSQGDMDGLKTKVVFKMTDYSLGKLLDLAPLNEVENEVFKATWGTIGGIGGNQTEDQIKTSNKTENQ